jgi:LysR family transcriptional regulator, hydrogen peroxide-inducible genes activator
MKLKAHAFTLRQLQYAVALADTLNLGHAAALCHVQQPALRDQVAQLEDALGVPLFERSKRNQVVVTAAGEDVLQRARRLLADADDLAQGARRVRDPLAGALRIGVGHAIAPSLLPEVAATLRDRFPKLTALWIEDTTEVLLKSLAAGELDAALLALGRDEPAGVEREVVASEPAVVELTWPRRSPLAGSLRQLADALRDALNDPSP